MKMPFGKHQGRNVHKLPKSYLKWLSENLPLVGELKAEVHRLLHGEPLVKQAAVIVTDEQVAAAVRTFDDQLADNDQ